MSNYYNMTRESDFTSVSVRDNYFHENDDGNSFSSLSSQGTDDYSSFGNSNHEKSPIQKQNTGKKRGSPTSVLMNELDELVASSSNLKNMKEKTEEEPGSTLVNEDLCNTSIGLSECDKTERTCKSEGTIYTKCTDASGATLLHQNGVVAMLRKKMKGKEVPTSIDTTKHSFGDEMFGDAKHNISLIQARQRDYEKKIFSKSRLKGFKAASDISKMIHGSEEILSLDYSDSVEEDGSYYAGSQAVNGFLRSLLSCCRLDVVHE